MEQTFGNHDLPSPQIHGTELTFQIQEDPATICKLIRIAAERASSLMWDDTRTITSSDTQRITDGTVLCDCSNLTGADLAAGRMTFQCLPAAQVPNVYLVVQKEVFSPPDGMTVTILPASGELIADGSPSIVLTGDDNVAEIKFHG